MATRGLQQRHRYLLQSAVDRVGPADVKAQEDRVGVAVAERPDVVVVRRTWTDMTTPDDECVILGNSICQKLSLVISSCFQENAPCADL